MSEVVIYTIPGCPYCKAAKDDFQRRGIAYQEIDVAGDKRARQEMVALSGDTMVPVIVEGEKVTVGFGGG